MLQAQSHFNVKASHWAFHFRRWISIKRFHWTIRKWAQHNGVSWATEFWWQFIVKYRHSTHDCACPCLANARTMLIPFFQHANDHAVVWLFFLDFLDESCKSNWIVIAPTIHPFVKHNNGSRLSAVTISKHQIGRFVLTPGMVNWNFEFHSTSTFDKGKLMFIYLQFTTHIMQLFASEIRHNLSQSICQVCKCIGTFVLQPLAIT